MKIKLKYIIYIVIGIILYYIVNTLCLCNVERFIISGGKGGGFMGWVQTIIGTASKPEDEGTRCTDSLWEDYPEDYAMYFSEEEFKKIENNLCMEFSKNSLKCY